MFAEDFAGSGRCAKAEPENKLFGVYNYFQGRDPSYWRANVPAYGEVTYRDVWPRIDVKIYGNPGIPDRQNGRGCG